MLYIMCIGAKLQYKPLYIHCKFILGILFLCSCNYTVILQRFLKLSGSVHYFFSGVYNHAGEQARSEGTCSQG